MRWEPNPETQENLNWGKPRMRRSSEK
jgi:hypothetical protein